MQNYSNYYSPENLNYSSQLNLSSAPNKQTASNVKNPSYDPANQPYYSNYFKEFNNPPNQNSLQAQLLNEQIQNGVQNSNRNLLNKFRGGNQRIEPMKQAPNSQDRQNHNFPARVNQSINAPDEEMSSITNALSSLDTAFMSHDEFFNNSRREQVLHQENNQQNGQIQFELNVNNAIINKRVNAISLVNQVAMQAKKINPNFEVQYPQSNINFA